MIHFCRVCGSMNHHDAAVTFAVPCTECGEASAHQPHDPGPALRAAEFAVGGVVPLPSAVVVPAGTRVHVAEAVGVLDISAPAEPVVPEKPAPRQRRSRSKPST